MGAERVIAVSAPYFNRAAAGGPGNRRVRQTRCAYMNPDQTGINGSAVSANDAMTGAKMLTAGYTSFMVEMLAISTFSILAPTCYAYLIAPNDSQATDFPILDQANATLGVWTAFTFGVPVGFASAEMYPSLQLVVRNFDPDFEIDFMLAHLKMAVQ